MSSKPIKGSRNKTAILSTEPMGMQGVVNLDAIAEVHNASEQTEIFSVLMSFCVSSPVLGLKSMMSALMCGVTILCAKFGDTKNLL